MTSKRNTTALCVLFATALIFLLLTNVSAFNYQNSVNFSATPLNDYQISLALTPSNFNYSAVKANGDDIRFFDLSGNKLSYFIESWNLNGNSKIWIKIPTAGTNSIVMKYGDSSLNSESNGTATFYFYDDFSNGLDLTKWFSHSASGSVGVSGGELVETTNTNGITWGANAYTNTNFNLASEGYVVMVSYRYPKTYCDTNGPYIALVDKNSVNFPAQAYYDYPNIFAMVEQVKSGDNSIPVNNCTLKITLYNQTNYKIENVSGDCTTYDRYSPFNTLLSINTNPINSVLSPNSIDLGQAEYSGSGQDCPSTSINPIYWDNIGVRKFFGVGDIQGTINSTNSTKIILNYQTSNYTLNLSFNLNTNSSASSCFANITNLGNGTSIKIDNQTAISNNSLNVISTSLSAGNYSAYVSCNVSFQWINSNPVNFTIPSFNFSNNSATTISNLHVVSKSTNYILWSWDVSGSFSNFIVSFDGTNSTTTSNSFNATGLSQNSAHTITVWANSFGTISQSISGSATTDCSGSNGGGSSHRSNYDDTITGDNSIQIKTANTTNYIVPLNNVPVQESKSYFWIDLLLIVLIVLLIIALILLAR